MVTPLQIAELVAAALMPIGLYFIMTQVRDVRWVDLSQGIVVVAVPALFILAVEDIVPNVAAAVFTGLLFGHMTTYLDDN